MVVALFMFVSFGILGWQRAKRKGGQNADRWQYAMAHAFPAFIITMILMTIAARMGWLG